jgi:aromatic ring-opening dioxygenase catalytic subunit (LigB family)
MRAFDFNGEEIEDVRNNAFQDSLIEICCIETDESSRYELLADWDKLPHARYCHPREEHLLPLHVCAAAATGQAD